MWNRLHSIAILISLACAAAGCNPPGRHLQSIAVSPGTTALQVGGSQIFVAQGTYSDQTIQDISDLVLWNLPQSNVAALSANKVTALSIGAATLTATLAGISGSAKISVGAASSQLTIQTIQITAPNTTAAVGAVIQFKATAIFSDHTTADLTNYLQWSAADPTVLALSSTTPGKFTALKAGSSTVIATDRSSGKQGALAAAYIISNALANSLALQVPQATIAAGTQEPLSGIMTLNDLSQRDYTSQLVWSSSAPAIVSVGATAGSYGLVKGLSTGSATITASDPNSGLSASTLITVSAATLSSIEISAKNAPVLALPAGTTLKLVATGVFSDGSTQDITQSVSWSSTGRTGSGQAVASVSNAAGNQGLLSALAPGNASIGASINTLGSGSGSVSGVTASASLEVTSAVLHTISIQAPSFSLAQNASANWAAIGTYTDGTIADLTSAVTWSSSAPAIAPISNANGSHGLVQALSAGSATISLVDPGSGLTAAAALTVTPALVSISVSLASNLASVGDSSAVSAIAHYSDGSTQEITATASWSVSNSSVLSLTPAGTGTPPLVKASATGSAQVIAQYSNLTGSVSVTIN